MEYSIFVATDCNGKKVNLRFLFDAYGPSVTQILNRATIAFNNYFHLSGIPRTFAASSAVVFNDAKCSWDVLDRSTQLIHNSQVYLFQPDILDLPAEIEEPSEGMELLGDSYTSPRRHASNSPRAAAPLQYAPRAPFTHASPQPAPMLLPYGRSGSHGRGRHHGAGEHQYGGPRSGSYGLVGSDKSPSYRTPAAHAPSSASPPARRADDSYYATPRSGSRGGSILRDERDKIEHQWHMPLDEMRRSLKAETREMERSISPQRGVSY